MTRRAGVGMRFAHGGHFSLIIANKETLHNTVKSDHVIDHVIDKTLNFKKNIADAEKIAQHLGLLWNLLTQMNT